jgi:probable rRNA maturation factor
MLEVEVLGAQPGPDEPAPAEVRALCRQAAAAAGIHDGHVAIEFVDEQRIVDLNGAHRGRPVPTDVLSFPIDGVDHPGGAEVVTRELGDVVICEAHTRDIREAIVHGMLHLLGMDHEIDDGEMLALQRRLLQQAAR